jgi:transposase-like protein
VRPSKEELAQLVQSENMCAIGRKYGVSDNAIRKWCKYYGIEYENKKSG